MSDNLTNRTSMLGAMPTLVAARAVYYYEKLKVARGLLGPDSLYLVPDGAQAITVQQLDYLTFLATTEATAQEAETFTLGGASAGGRELKPVVVGSNVLVGIESMNSSAIDPVDMFAEAAATAWAAYDDTALLALYGEAPSSPDHEIGADSTAYTAALVRQGVALLLAAGAKQPYNLLIDPIQFEELMRDAEAKQFLMSSKAAGSSYAATTGVSMDRYLGQIYGCNIWVCNACAESSGLHSIMFGQKAMGIGYKMLSTPLSGGSSEMAIDIEYMTGPPRYRVGFYVMQHCSGTAFTSTTNKFMVDIIS